MYMSVHEITSMYKEAADKNAQIEILADLNVCSKREILKVLEEAGAISGVKAKKEGGGQSRGTKKAEKMTWTDEAKSKVRKFLEEGLTVLEVAERMGLDVTQVRNAVTRFKLKEKKEGGVDNPSVGKADSSLCTKEPSKNADVKSTLSADERVEPLGIVSLIRDYAKCITALPSADIRNYEKIVRTFAESIIEGADGIINFSAKE